MAYFVLALGVLMSIAGLDAIATGYPIIQVERGWATVIAGSGMLTGGLVTIALGVAIRVLLQIKATLRLPGISRPEPEVAAPLPTPVAAEPRPVAARTDTPSLADAVPALAVAAPAVAAAAAAEHSRALSPVLTTTEPEPEEKPPSESPAFDPSAEPEQVPHHVEPEAEPSHAEPASVPDTYEMQTPSTADHDLASKPEDRPIAPLSEDWLDQAFSAFDQELGRTKAAEPLAPVHDTVTSEPEPTKPEPIHEAPNDSKPSEYEPIRSEPFGHRPEPSEPEALVEPEDQAIAGEPAPPMAHEPADLAVIGRYEADGTLYVMYSDGSIEAQSETGGIHRFGSMAELKAFIEG